MYSYSDTKEFKLEYWVRDESGSLVRRFNSGSLYYARQEAKSTQGIVFEVTLDNQEGSDIIIAELEI